MPKISDGEIAGAAIGAGLSGGSVAIAVAIALAESRGNTEAHNAVPPDDSYGLWQINMLGALGPSRRQQFGIGSNAELYQPSINAKAMVMLSNSGQNWRPWTTYTRGTYLAYMARGNTAAANPSQTSGATVTPVGLAASLNGISNLLAALMDPRRHIRTMILFAGVGLVFYGFMKMTGDNSVSETTKGLVKGAVGLIPGGSTAVQVGKSAVKVVT